MTIANLQPEKDLAPVCKWTGLAKWLLIANLVFVGIRVLVDEPEDLIVSLPSLVCIWGIYKFKRLGFYVLAAIYVTLALISFGAAAYAPYGTIREEIVPTIAWYAGRLLVISLIVRSRWKDMDPVFKAKSTPEGQ